ncbi:MAG: hypothetical protein H7A23_18085 [Leptospiraceae bacterium]|nr:hypothetical protein [Leptospiraceae bacterium]
MQTIDEIKLAIESLPPKEYTQFRSWFLEKDWEKWDKQIQEDSENGLLDFFKMEVKHEKLNGLLKTL